MTLVVRLTVRRQRAHDFQRFEREAARIMARHGGAIERVVTIGDAATPGSDLFTEVHLVTFPDQAAFDAYQRDPELAGLQPLRAAAVVDTQLSIGVEDRRAAGPQAAAEVLGIDHLYLSVRSLAISEAFYDRLLVTTLGFRKNRFELGTAQHVQYYNRQLGLVIRPARAGAPEHDPGLPGLHHLCLRVPGPREVERVAAALVNLGIAASPPRLLPEYAPDYYATYLSDPDGLRLEITNFRAERQARMYRWDE